MSVKLTKANVTNAHTPDKPLFLFDTELPGFCLKVTKAGRKVFQLRYRVAGRSSTLRTYTIGQFSKPWTVETARKEAQALLGDVRRQIDPAAEKKRKAIADAGAVTVEALSREFLNMYASQMLKPRSYVEYERAFRGYINPQLGSIRVRDLAHGDVRRLHHAMRNTAVTANRTIQVLSKFMSWAIEGNYRTDRLNPCKGLKKYREEPRKRYLSLSEMEAVGTAIRDLEASRRLSPWQAALFRCLLLTGMRSSELRLMKWAWVDVAGAYFRLPDSKSGARDIPIAGPVLRILQQLPRIEGCPYVFAGRTAGKPLANTRWPWQIIANKAEIKAARIHDLRHSAASIGVSANISLLLIGGVLGHKSSQTTQRYAHRGADPLRATSETIAEHVSKAMEGTSDEVVQLQARSKLDLNP